MCPYTSTEYIFRSGIIGVTLYIYVFNDERSPLLERPLQEERDSVLYSSRPPHPAPAELGLHCSRGRPPVGACRLFIVMHGLLNTAASLATEHGPYSMGSVAVVCRLSCST